jgi:hypothetical protein
LIFFFNLLLLLLLLLLAKSSEWKNRKSRIFNYRKIIFNPLVVEPNEIVQDILLTLSILSCLFRFQKRYNFQSRGHQNNY